MNNAQDVEMHDLPRQTLWVCLFTCNKSLFIHSYRDNNKLHLCGSQESSQDFIFKVKRCEKGPTKLQKSHRYEVSLLSYGVFHLSIKIPKYWGLKLGPWVSKPCLSPLETLPLACNQNFPNEAYRVLVP